MGAGAKSFEARAPRFEEEGADDLLEMLKRGHDEKMASSSFHRRRSPLRARSSHGSLRPRMDTEFMEYFVSEIVEPFAKVAKKKARGIHGSWG